MASDPSNILDVEGLQTRIRGKAGDVHAVDDVSFAIRSGEAFGVAGESRSGKSMTAPSILRLLPYHGRIVAGKIRFQGHDLVTLPAHAMRDLRGNRIAMIFQDPMSSLNPVFTVGAQIAEAKHTAGSPPPTLGAKRSASCGWWKYRNPRIARTPIRTFSAAACASAS